MDILLGCHYHRCEVGDKVIIKVMSELRGGQLHSETSDVINSWVMLYFGHKNCTCQGFEFTLIRQYHFEDISIQVSNTFH